MLTSFSEILKTLSIKRQSNNKISELLFALANYYDLILPSGFLFHASLYAFNLVTQLCTDPLFLFPILFCFLSLLVCVTGFYVFLFVYQCLSSVILSSSTYLSLSLLLPLFFALMLQPASLTESGGIITN